jgi:hypothetical protein
MLRMRSRGISILVCVLTAFCPLLCAGERCASSAEHVASDCAEHQHEHGGSPPQHDPLPHGDHTCLCSGSTAPGAALQAPPLEPAGLIAAGVTLRANPAAAAAAVRWATSGFPDLSSSARIAPLLI